MRPIPPRIGPRKGMKVTDKVSLKLIHITGLGPLQSLGVNTEVS